MLCLTTALQRVPDQELTDMVHYIRGEITRHANRATQSDGVTMIAIKYRGMQEDRKG